MSKTITGVMPIRTVGLTPGHRWCGGLRSVKSVVNNGKGAPGLVQGPNSLNASYTHPGRISGTPRKLARDLRNRHLVLRTVKGPPRGNQTSTGPAKRASPLAHARGSAALWDGLDRCGVGLLALTLTLTLTIGKLDPGFRSRLVDPAQPLERRFRAAAEHRRLPRRPRRSGALVACRAWHGPADAGRRVGLAERSDQDPTAPVSDSSTWGCLHSLRLWSLCLPVPAGDHSGTGAGRYDHRR